MSEPEPEPEGELIHRLKNHLCIIVGFCDLLLADFPSDDQRHADLLEVQQAARDAMTMMPAIANGLLEAVSLRRVQKDPPYVVSVE